MPASWRDISWTTGPWHARLVRRFGLPRTLDDYERVWITCAGASDSSKWSLNDTAIGEWTKSAVDVEMEITGLLKPRNELAIHIESASCEGGLWGEVALEIRGAYYLRDVVIKNETLTGTVVGEPNAPLEIYVLRFGRTVRYELVRAAPEGRPFAFPVPFVELGAAMGDFPPWRIDLVEGANRWFTVDRPDPDG